MFSDQRTLIFPQINANDNIKITIVSKKHKQKHKPELQHGINTLPPDVQTFEQKLLLGNGFIVLKRGLKFFN